MSASPLIATTEADISKLSCLLYPQELTCAVQLAMLAKGQKQTSLRPFLIWLYLVQGFCASTVGAAARLSGDVVWMCIDPFRVISTL